MKKTFIFAILFVPLSVFADNIIFNGGFDMVPWDTGWVKETSTDTSYSGSGQAGATAEIKVSDSAISFPHSCNLRTLASTSWGGGVYGEANASASASIMQTFSPISNCLIKVSAIDSVWATGKFGWVYGVDLYINSNWKTWGVVVYDNKWTDICTTITEPDMVAGIKLISHSYGGGAGAVSYLSCMRENIWVDDVQITETGIEEILPPPGRGVATLQISPNPFVQKTIVRFEDSKLQIQDYKIAIYDIVGKLVEETKNNIIGKDLKAGVYFIKANGYKLTKIIKLEGVR